MTSAPRQRTAAISLAVWTVPAVLSTIETVAFASRAGHPIAVWRAFLAEAPQWYCWALFTPVVITLARRFPFSRPTRFGGAVVHVIACLTGGVLTATADAAVDAALRPSGNPFALSVEGWFLSALPATAVAYAAIVAVSTALANASRLRERDRRAAELEAKLRDAQLAALRMQLQPHFLFNSLNAVMALVRDGDTPGALRALALLADVLRAVVNADAGHETTLADEVVFIERLLAIERLRFGDRLHVVVDIPAYLGGARVPVFILQPFVENALKHGVLRGRESNTISVTAARRGDGIVLSVRDDGGGLSSPSSGGVGIANTRARLAGMYGDAGYLRVATAPDGCGVHVEIQLPLRS
jgi:two-component system, LytTR family, sensor kinase